MNVKYHLLASCVFWCCSFEYIFCGSCCNEVGNSDKGTGNSNKMTENKFKQISINNWYDCTREVLLRDDVFKGLHVFLKSKEEGAVGTFKFEKDDLGVNVRVFKDSKDPITVLNGIMFIITSALFEKQCDDFKQRCGKIGEFYFSFIFAYCVPNIKAHQFKDGVNKYKLIRIDTGEEI